MMREIMEYLVRDGIVTLKFNGTKLAESSSRFVNKPRWVEFQLFKTYGGQYVLARIGISVIYHTEKCAVVSRNKLSQVNGEDLSAVYTPCEKCNPSLLGPDGVYPETPRYWAQASEKPQGVIDALIQYDNNGTRYLTNVAKELLEDASKYDEKIRQAFLFDFIE